MGLRRGIALLGAAVLLAGCGQGVPISSAAASSAAGAHSARPAATVRATYTVRRDGRINVRLASNAKVALVRFRRVGITRTVRRRLASGNGHVALPRGAVAIRVRGLATKRLSPSRWVRAVHARQPAPPAPPGTPDSGVRTALAVVARQRVFFGHQSVGRNILDAIPAVYRRHGMSPPPIVGASSEPPAGSIAETEIGKNTEPLSKIMDFDRALRAGMATRLDVALMKLCYVDVTEGTDVRALFDTYRSTMAALAADHPDLVLLHVTTPLTTDGKQDNVARERLNALMRQEYAASGRLFDLAALESTRPDGTRVQWTDNGERYFALYDGYASDQGHLNGEGAQRAAAALLQAVAAASQT